jgi:hypothetical protein
MSEYSYGDIIISSALTTLVGLFSYHTYKIYSLRQKYKHIPGPPANGLLGFYLGNTIELLSKKRQGMVLVDVYNEWYEFQVI